MTRVGGHWGALRICMPPQHFQVTSCQDVKVHRVALLRERREQHRHEDIEGFGIARAVCDFLNKGSCKLRTPALAFLAVFSLDAETIRVAGHREFVGHIVESPLNTALEAHCHLDTRRTGTRGHRSPSPGLIEVLRQTTRGQTEDAFRVVAVTKKQSGTERGGEMKREWGRVWEIESNDCDKSQPLYYCTTSTRTKATLALGTI
mmetsp:Transcript_56598/g.123799  ORF Transcript_56598/g.123799 Transcript_56598/m.123799 type:complete len:204 (+) Transcript_56598:2059-2670(+)